MRKKLIFTLVLSLVFLAGCADRDERLVCVEQFIRDDSGMPKWLNLMLSFVRHGNDDGLEDYLSYLDKCWATLEQEGIRIEEPAYDLQDAIFGPLSPNEKEALRELFRKQGNE